MSLLFLAGPSSTWFLLLLGLTCSSTSWYLWNSSSISWKLSSAPSWVNCCSYHYFQQVHHHHPHPRQECLPLQDQGSYYLIHNFILHQGSLHSAQQGQLQNIQAGISSATTLSAFWVPPRVPPSSSKFVKEMRSPLILSLPSSVMVTLVRGGVIKLKFLGSFTARHL